MKLRLRSVPDEALQLALDARTISTDESYSDSYCCALLNAELIGESDTRWRYICGSKSSRKYKIAVRPTFGIGKDDLLVSETTKFNILRHLKVSEFETDRYFIIAASDTESEIAEEAEISLIKNSLDYTEEFLDSSLRSYFSSARYLRLGDVVSIDIEKHSPHHRHAISLNSRANLLFQVVHLSVGESNLNPRKGCFVVRGITTLVQKQNIHGYAPPGFTILAGRFEGAKLSEALASNCPPALEAPLRSLISCIRPFALSDSFVDVDPLFLVKGPRGCGKSSLVRIAARRMGFNLVNVDLSEVRSLTVAQTEAKLRIVLENARNCVPGILLLSNIQIFGKDAEGKEDHRTISSFDTESKNIIERTRRVTNLPLLIVATSDNGKLPPSLDQLFIETIKLGELNREERSATLEWLVKIKGLDHAADLTSVAALCGDHVIGDLNAMVLHAAKTMTSSPDRRERLTQKDFDEAHEYMRSRYSDWIGSPRVPEVRWEDIGGLAKLKGDILRGIELPLLTPVNSGLRRSGLLLYGPPGTGKTLLAKAVATECQVQFLSVKGPELLNMYVGQSEKNVREVFARARSSSPCVIFFDELDSLAPKRGLSGDSGGVMDRVVSQLLSEIDGMDGGEEREGGGRGGSVFVIGATNRPDMIDPALLRPGRFDKLLYVGIPSDLKSKLGVIRALTRRFEFPSSRDVFFQQLEELVDNLAVNLTGADLYAICSNAWLAALRRRLNDKRESDGDRGTSSVVVVVVVDKEDFIEAAKRVRPSITSDELKRYETIKSELG